MTIVFAIAGVAISMITGQDNLFGKADDARAKYTDSSKNEAEGYDYWLATLNNNDYSGAGETLSTDWLNKIYPIGSIYISTSSDMDTAEKVTSVLGGTWEAYGKGRTLVGVDSEDSSIDSAGKEGRVKNA